MTTATGIDGLVIVDKPGGMTSHDVVARIRRLAGTRRVGHAGTLDPMATGVLVVGVEKATRLLGYLTLTEKQYDATIRLGQSTSTDDAEGEITGGAGAEGALTVDLDRADRGRHLLDLAGQAVHRVVQRCRGNLGRRRAAGAETQDGDRLRVHGHRRPPCGEGWGGAQAICGGPPRRRGDRALLERHLHPGPGP